MVEDIAAVDTTKETVFFTEIDEATGKHPYCASFSQEAASKITKLTSHISGWHTVAVSTASACSPLFTAALLSLPL